MLHLFFGSLFIIIGIILYRIRKIKAITEEGATWAVKDVGIFFIVVAILIVMKGAFFIADADRLYIIQYPTGTLINVYIPGIKFTGYGKVYPYDRVVAVSTPAFISESDEEEKAENDDTSTRANEDSKDLSTIRGIISPPTVRFTDAAKAKLYGIVRIALPTDREGLLKIHQEFGSTEALVNNLLKSTFRSVALSSARLMSIQDYITKRGADFDEYFSDQFAFGLYKIKMSETRMEAVAPAKGDAPKVVDGIIRYSKQIVEDKRATIREIVRIVVDSEGKYVRQGIDDIKRYNLVIVTARITYINPEKRVRVLIGSQRDAEARSSLAENNRRAALLEAQSEEAEGQKQVAKARAKELTIQTQKTIAAETRKQEAVIEKQQELEMARLNKEAAVVKEQQKLEVSKLNKEVAKQKALAAMEYKKEQILIGEGDAARKKAVMIADGALEQKLEVYREVNRYYAESIMNYQGQWVPTIIMGNDRVKEQNGAQTLIDLLTAKTAQDLSLDFNIPKGNK